MSRYVLDSFAVLAAYRLEEGATRVLALLRDPGNEFWMSVVNLGEVYYRATQQRRDGTGALEFVDKLSVAIVEADRSLALAAAGLKARYRMSYADCFAAALAQQLGAAVVTGDPEFHEVQHLIDIEWLPQRQTR